MKSSAVTAGVGNPILATLELAGSVLIAAIALLAPAIALIIAVVFVVVVVKRFNAWRPGSARGTAQSSTR